MYSARYRTVYPDWTTVEERSRRAVGAVERDESVSACITGKVGSAVKFCANSGLFFLFLQKNALLMARDKYHVQLIVYDFKQITIAQWIKL